MKKYFEIGQIVTTNGVKGFVKVKPFTDDIKRFGKLKTVFVSKKDEMIEYNIQEVKYLKNMVVLKLEGINSIEEAEKLKNFYIKIDRADAEELPKDSYFIADLLECDVYTIEDIYLGKIDDIFPTGSNDVYVVKDKSGKQILLPAIQSVIKQVDIENRKIVVDLIEGLV